MSGFHRQGLPNTIAKPVPVYDFVHEREIAAVLGDADPFLIDDLCTLSPTGQHSAIASCGEVVCCHCSKVFWR